MTTVAASNGCMAADTQLSGAYRVRARKILKLPDGSIVGGAGDWSAAWNAMLWLAGGKQGDPPTFEGASLLIMQPDGSLWVADEIFPAFPLLDECAAIGSGSAAAMALMEAGFSAADAVRKTCKRDCGSSEPVQVEHLPRKAKKRK